MKKILTVLALSCVTVLASTTSFAAPPFAKQQHFEARGEYSDARDWREERDNLFEQRRLREERGVKRLKQHKWQTGYVMPQHYRGEGYKVEYKDHNLSKPSRHQQWYKINNDYILVDSDSNGILRIVSD
ncbi:RcnB family protein [Acinetobacter sp. CAAS 2-6]|uniref:RcnB family protein n=1 Tax=Acinetobacter sp. CAAS 2-6 TaxID=3016358 RepID=UPI002DD66257|nr:RcnB family protein [Acinetobacter sp. CAAS 2-6]